MLSRIFDLVNRVYPARPVPDTRNDDGILIVNERMAFACRVTENKEGYFNLFIFDLLTGDELQQNHYQSFPNVNLALVEAHRIVNRIYPTRPVPDTGNDDGILIVNERMAFACRVDRGQGRLFQLV
jgi:hypothetical protein